MFKKAYPFFILVLLLFISTTANGQQRKEIYNLKVDGGTIKGYKSLGVFRRCSNDKVVIPLDTIPLRHLSDCPGGSTPPVTGIYQFSQESFGFETTPGNLATIKSESAYFYLPPDTTAFRIIVEGRAYSLASFASLEHLKDTTYMAVMDYLRDQAISGSRIHINYLKYKDDSKYIKEISIRDFKE